jgi:hypothetical protein
MSLAAFIKKQKENNYVILAFFVLCVFSILLLRIINHYIITDDIYQKTVSEQLSVKRVDEALANRFKYEWLNLVVTPVFKLLSFLIITLIIATGAYLRSYKISFVKIFTAVVYASFVFLLPEIIKIFYFMNIDNDFTMEQFRNFYPYSLLYYVNKESIDVWFYYPIYLINIIELFYCLVLAVCIRFVSKLSFLKSFFLIIQTYVVALILWTVFIIFISLNLS